MIDTQAPLQVDRSAQSDALGNATFIFANTPSGQVWTGTLLCAGAPSTAVFTAVIGGAATAAAGLGTNWGSWAGTSVFGPVQCNDGQVLVVKATGLTPSTPFELSWRGWSEDSSTAEAVYPVANNSAILGAVTQGAADLLFNQGVNFTGGTPVIELLTALHSYSALLVLVQANANTVVTVQSILLVGNAGPFEPQVQTSLGSSLGTTFTVPLPCSTGEQFELAITQSATINNAQVSIIGITSPVLTQVIAPNGNPLAVSGRGGATKATVTTVTAAISVPLIAAPPAGFVRVIKRIVHSWPAGVTSSVVQGVSSGATYSEMATQGNDLHEGTIAPEAINTTSFGAGGAIISCHYDTVPVQNVL